MHYNSCTIKAFNGHCILHHLILVIRSVTDIFRAQCSFVKFYTFYKPILGSKYVSNRPYNEFITPTTFLVNMIGIFNIFPLPILTLGKPWTQSMPSRDVNAAMRLAEASWSRDNNGNVMTIIHQEKDILTPDLFPHEEMWHKLHNTNDFMPRYMPTTDQKKYLLTFMDPCKSKFRLRAGEGSTNTL